MLWSPSLTVVVARQQYGRRHSLAQESRTHSSSLEHRSLITAFACRSLLSLEDESVLESDHTVVSECPESNNNEELEHVSDLKRCLLFRKCLRSCAGRVGKQFRCLRLSQEAWGSTATSNLVPENKEKNREHEHKLYVI